MSDVPKYQSVRSISWTSRAVTYTVVLLVGFMLGSLCMWVRSRETDTVTVQTELPRDA